MSKRATNTKIAEAENLNEIPVSVVLKNMLKQFPSKRISVEEISSALADRAFALLMLIFALPNLIPIPLPGISSILGLPLLFLSLQFMLGSSSPWFPKWLSKKSFSRKDIKKSILYAVPRIQKLEHYLKPRMSFLVSVASEKLIAFICFMMAVLIVLPIPLGNWLPAFTVFLFCLAIIEHDGLFVVFGFFSAIVSILFIGTLVFTSVGTGMFFLEKLFN